MMMTAVPVRIAYDVGIQSFYYQKKYFAVLMMSMSMIIAWCVRAQYDVYRNVRMFYYREQEQKK